jgi:uncharacterized membrane protein YczE
MRLEVRMANVIGVLLLFVVGCLLIGFVIFLEVRMANVIGVLLLFVVGCLLIGFVVFLNVADRRYLSTLTPKERAKLTEELELERKAW